MLVYEQRRSKRRAVRSAPTEHRVFVILPLKANLRLFYSALLRWSNLMIHLAESQTARRRQTDQIARKLSFYFHYFTSPQTAHAFSAQCRISYFNPIEAAASN